MVVTWIEFSQFEKFLVIKVHLLVLYRKPKFSNETKVQQLIGVQTIRIQLKYLQIIPV